MALAGYLKKYLNLVPAIKILIEIKIYRKLGFIIANLSKNKVDIIF